MKILTLKNYEDEILRLSNILVNEKCSKADDKLIKNLLEENLKNYELIKINSRRKSGLKQTSVDAIICNLETLINQDYESELDLNIKSIVQREISNIGRIEHEKNCRRAN